MKRCFIFCGSDQVAGATGNKKPAISGLLLSLQMLQAKLGQIVQPDIRQRPAGIVTVCSGGHHNRSHTRCFGGDHAVKRIFQRDAVERIDRKAGGGVEVEVVVHGGFGTGARAGGRVLGKMEGKWLWPPPTSGPEGQE